MRMTIKQEVQVITYSIWVTMRANCYMLAGFVEVEDIEWDEYLYTHTENLAIEEQTETKYLINKFIDEYKILNF